MKILNKFKKSILNILKLYVILFLFSCSKDNREIQLIKKSIYYPKSKIKICEYYVLKEDTNKIHGLYTFYYENGNIKSQSNFNYGKVGNSNIIYYDDGSIMGFCKIKNSITLEILGFYQNGQSKEVRKMKNEKFYNCTLMKDINGKDLEIGTFKDGNGSINNYDSIGTLFSVDFYKDSRNYRQIRYNKNKLDTLDFWW
ncbi:MAG: hypothetical protein NTW25_12665 [Candidatus Kapabacteria bacterium]|nr:hypothetical protein [Candidatus Kapabacteria bacterium]